MSACLQHHSLPRLGSLPAAGAALSTPGARGGALLAVAIAAGGASLQKHLLLCNAMQQVDTLLRTCQPDLASAPCLQSRLGLACADGRHALPQTHPNCLQEGVQTSTGTRVCCGRLTAGATSRSRSGQLCQRCAPLESALTCQAVHLGSPAAWQPVRWPVLECTGSLWPTCCNNGHGLTAACRSLCRRCWSWTVSSKTTWASCSAALCSRQPQGQAPAVQVGFHVLS